MPDEQITPEQLPMKPASAAELAVWEQRRIALEFVFDQVDERINRLRDNISDFTSDAATKKALLREFRVDDLADLVTRLRSFSKDLFFFFYHGFAHTAGYAFAPPLDLAGTKYEAMEADYSVMPFVLRRILEQVTFDLLTIDNAVDQRFVAFTTAKFDDIQNTATFEEKTMRGVTRVVDALAASALQMVNAPYLADNQRKATNPIPNALSYYRISAHARVIPYCELSIIGLPISTLRLLMELLSIPHEVGHHVYWNGVWPDSMPVKPFQIGLADHLTAKGLRADHPWLEEITCDLIGCLIGGPVTGWSIQEIMKGFVGAEFLGNSPTHPAPAIRPYLYAHVLQKDEHNAAIAQKLAAAWTTYLADERGIDIDKVIIDGKRLSQIQAQVEKMADAILDVLRIDTSQVRPWMDGKVEEGAPPLEVSQLEERFRTALSAILLNAIRSVPAVSQLYVPLEDEPVENITDNHKNLWQELVNKLFAANGLFESANLTWLQLFDAPPSEAPMASAPVPTPKVIAASHWLYVFEFGGWTDGGGTGGGNAQGKFVPN